MPAYTMALDTTLFIILQVQDSEDWRYSFPKDLKPLLQNSLEDDKFNNNCKQVWFKLPGYN